MIIHLVSCCTQNSLEENHFGVVYFLFTSSRNEGTDYWCDKNNIVLFLFRKFLLDRSFYCLVGSVHYSSCGVVAEIEKSQENLFIKCCMQEIRIVHILPEYRTKFVPGLLSSVWTDTPKELVSGLLPPNRYGLRS